MKTPITYEPSAGTHISHACKEAAAMAIKQNCDVEFEFNGIKVTATPQSSPASLEADWDTKMAAEAKAYRESAAYAAEQERRTEQVKTSQNVVNCFMDGIERVLATCSMDDVLKYFKPFVEAADDVAVTFDKTRLADLLEQYGYKDGIHVGKPQEAFKDKEVMAQYILGQVVSCLRKGMPPHPITNSFIEKYFAA
jgi:hypothetical protein